MYNKFIEIIRLLAHISGKMKSISADIDKLYDALSDEEVISILAEDNTKGE